MKSKKHRKGEKMSLRKFVSLLLLVAFTLTTVPAQAASLESSATLPTAVQEAGLIADGANLDVVPVTITVDDISGGSLELTVIQYDAFGGGNTNGATLSITTNGKLTIGGNGAILGGSDEKAFIITPPTGTKFVGLAHQDYTTVGVTMAHNGALVTENVGGDLANGVLPGAGANGNAAIARVITSAGPASYFGTGVTVPAGSIVAYFATADNNTGSNPIATSFTLTNIGLAVNPTGEATGTLTGNLSATYEEPGAGALIDEALGGGLADAATLAIAAIGTGEKLEFGMAASEDSQPNTVLGVLLSSAGNGVAISPAQITSTSSASALKVDTDALYIRAKTVTTGVYYQTPFATSEYAGSIIAENGSAATWNKLLTNTTTFPNTADALISVAFSVLDPSTGLAFASTDASIDVTAVSVSLVGEDIDTDIRGAITEANGGFLGNIINPILGNGGSAALETDTAVSVLYGTSATSVLAIKDATAIDYSAPTATTGFVAATGLTVIPVLANGATTSLVNPFLNGVFEGSFVASNDASAANGRAPVAVSAVNGTLATTYKMTFAGAVPGLSANADALYTPSEVTVRLTDITNGANAWFAITGTADGTNDDITAAGEIRVGPTNSATSNGAVVGETETSAVGIQDNVIAVARLSGNTLQILPVSNLIDGERDAIIIRPEIALTLKTTAARTAGAKVVAVASGNNLASTTVTVAQFTGTGSLDADILVKAIPVNGAFNKIMVENGVDAFNGRAAIALTSIDGSTTSLDNYVDLIDNGNGLVLDETLPSLFCGGTIGDGEKGANAVLSQSKAVGILITENGQADAFSTVADNSNTAIRVTLPSGWDINKFSATQSDILGIFTSGGFTNGLTIGDVSINEINSDKGVSQAYVDIDGFTLDTTNDLDRAFTLVFKQDALVAPVGVSDFTATITMVFDNGTTTTADDTLLASLGTVSLGTECATGLTLGFCGDVISGGSTVGSDLESDLTSNGANLTSFSSTPTGALRIVQSNITAENVRLPDLCIGEGSADLFSEGTDAEGGFGGTGYVYIYPSSTSSTDAIGFNTTTVDVSATDNSLTLAADPDSTDFGGNGDELAIAISDASNTLRPDEVTSRIRVSNAVLKGPNDTIYPQSLVAVYVNSNTSAPTGDSFPFAYYEDSTNGDAIVGRTSGTLEDQMAAHYYNADVLGNTALTLLDFNGGDAALTFAFENTTAPIITGAVTSIIDNDNYDQLSEDDEDVISVSVSDITGSTSKKVIVSAPAGTLEPKSTLAITLSGTGSTDSVTVPVLADGSFQATITADTTQTIILTQTPSSGRTDLSPQILELDVTDANVAPQLLSAIVTDIGLSNVTAKGYVPVVFTVTATGKVNGDSFIPSAANLTLGDNPVTAVTGTTDQFIAELNYFKATGKTLYATTSEGNSNIALSGAGLSVQDPTLGGRPRLFKVKNNSKGYVVLKGKRLKNNGFFYFVLDDGTIQAVDMRSATRNDKRRNRRRSDDVVTIPTNALYGVYTVPGRGVDTVEL